MFMCNLQLKINYINNMCQYYGLIIIRHLNAHRIYFWKNVKAFGGKRKMIKAFQTVICCIVNNVEHDWR